MVERSVFDQYVLEALRSYNDPVRLRLSPLVQLMGLGDTIAESSSTALRLILSDSIGQLRPESSTVSAEHSSIGYSLLWMHYVRSKSRVLTCQELALSESSFYRHRNEALSALAEILWCRYKCVCSITNPVSSQTAAGTEASRLTQQTGRVAVSLNSILRGARQIILPLVQDRQISLHVHESSLLTEVQADPALLRQALISTLLELLSIQELVGLTLGTLAAKDQVGMSVSAECIGFAESTFKDLDQSDGISLAAAIIGAYGGELSITARPASVTVALSIPIQRSRTILVIDDDADTFRLYCAYLTGYNLELAQTEDQVRAQASRARPDLVLLDLLMPLFDGWDVLAFLRAEAQYDHVPIVICSVLSQPRLAISMGATAVLQKPIRRTSLVGTVETLMEMSDRQDEPL